MVTWTWTWTWTCDAMVAPMGYVLLLVMWWFVLVTWTWTWTWTCGAMVALMGYVTVAVMGWGVRVTVRWSVTVTVMGCGVRVTVTWSVTVIWSVMVMGHLAAGGCGSGALGCRGCRVGCDGHGGRMVPGLWDTVVWLAGVCVLLAYEVQWLGW